jgi:hypothetical protein
MLEDHYLISDARVALSDALRALLKADLMVMADFQASHERAIAAVAALDELLRITPK